MDDVWDDEGNVPSNATKVERENYNRGYLDGVTEAKRQHVQKGFDEGHVEGGKIGVRVGRIIGGFQALGLSDLESIALKELSVDKLFNFDYYDRQARPLFSGSDHPLLIKWEQKLKEFQ